MQRNLIIHYSLIFLLLIKKIGLIIIFMPSLFTIHYFFGSLFIIYYSLKKAIIY